MISNTEYVVIVVVTVSGRIHIVIVLVPVCCVMKTKSVKHYDKIDLARTIQPCFTLVILMVE